MTPAREAGRSPRPGKSHADAIRRIQVIHRKARELFEERGIRAGYLATGKSQTIANLIAALVAHGRKVLFVAEKRAAIDAVL